MKKFFQDFKKFITRGNVVDMAVGVVVGGAFGKIVTSLVNDIIMPLISLATGGAGFANWKWVIVAADEANSIAEVSLHWGSFLQTILDFLIIAFCIFLMLRLMMSAQKSLDSVAGQSARARRKAVRAYKKQGMTKTEAVMKVDADEAEAKAEAERKAEEEKKNAPPTTDELLTQIRDLLAAQQKSDETDK